MNDEANVEIARKKEQDSQIFTVTYLNNGFYKILNKHSGKSLDVYIGNAVRGTNVQQYGGRHQCVDNRMDGRSGGAEMGVCAC